MDPQKASAISKRTTRIFVVPAVDPCATELFRHLEESTFLASDSLPPLNEFRARSVNTKQSRGQFTNHIPSLFPSCAFVNCSILAAGAEATVLDSAIPFQRTLSICEAR